MSAFFILFLDRDIPSVLSLTHLAFANHGVDRLFSSRVSWASIHLYSLDLLVSTFLSFVLWVLSHSPVFLCFLLCRHVSNVFPLYRLGIWLAVGFLHRFYKFNGHNASFPLIARNCSH
jgi:hypothetical protein